MQKEENLRVNGEDVEILNAPQITYQDKKMLERRVHLLLVAQKTIERGEGKGCLLHTLRTNVHKGLEHNPLRINLPQLCYDSVNRGVLSNHASQEVFTLGLWEFGNLGFWELQTKTKRGHRK